MFRQKLQPKFMDQAITSAAFRIENDFYSEANALRSQMEESMSRGYQAGLTPFSYVFSQDRFQFLTASAETIFTPDSLQKLVEILANWGQQELDASHVSTPQVRVYLRACKRSLLQDTVMLGWHYMLSLSSPRTSTGSARVQLLVSDRPANSSKILGICDVVETDLRFNRFLVHDTQDAYGIQLRHDSMNPLEATVFLDGYFW